jgi:hypothetical protein
MTECKKSDKPWVFFTTPEDHRRDDRLGRIIKWRFGGVQAFTDNRNPESLISDLELRSFHHYFQHGRLARTFHQPFRGKEELDDSPLSAADEALIEERLAEHHADPNSSIPLDELKKRLRR